MPTASAKPVALITGGARRVGRAIGLTLADAGFDVAFTYRKSRVEADELVALLQSKGAKAIAIAADLTEPEPAAVAIEQAIRETFGRLNVLVNNASIYQPSGLQTATLTQLRRFQAIHVESPFLLCQRFEPLLRAARGHVINMIDLLAERPWPKFMGYCASKAGLANLTLSLARELSPEVTVNGIAPGVAEWPADYPEADKVKYLQRVPLARPGTPQDTAELVRFLVTGGTYITGQIIRLDGGRSIT
jgi:pteridine reductase